MYEINPLHWLIVFIIFGIIDAICRFMETPRSLKVVSLIENVGWVAVLSAMAVLLGHAEVLIVPAGILTVLAACNAGRICRGARMTYEKIKKRMSRTL